MNWPYRRKWDIRFLELAKHVAEWSKDESTKCGAVIVRDDKSVASVGFNGFSRGIADLPERLADRETKYSLIIHAELNCILSAHEPVRGYTLYVYPLLTCERCAVHVVQAGIKRVVAPICPDDKLSRWGESLANARAIYREAGVECLEILELN